MNYQLSILDKIDYHLLDDLAKKVSLNEKIDKECIFIKAEDKGILVGVIGFKTNTDSGLPRLEHIILDKSYQRTRLGVILLNEMERLFKNLGHNKYYSYIMNDNERMKSYARHWGMELTKIGEKGSWYNKMIKENKYEATLALAK